MHSDFYKYSDEQVDAVVSSILEEVDLPQTYGVTIRSLVRSRAQNWRTCCGGTCNPCIGKIEEAVDRVREILLANGPLVVEKSAESPAPKTKSADPAPSTESSDEDAKERNWGLDYA